MVKIAGRENPDLLQQVLTFDTEVNETTCNFYVLRRRGEEPDMFLDMPVVLAWAKAYQTALKAHLYVSQFPVVRDEFKNYLLQHGVPPDFVSDDSWVSRIDRLLVNSQIDWMASCLSKLANGCNLANILMT